MNDRMKRILKEGKQDERRTKTRFIAEEIIEKTKLIKECIIYDEKQDLDESKINFDIILKIVKDLTEYEISCNELRFYQDEIPVDQILYFVESIESLLSLKYKERKFGIIVSIQKEEIELRFHTFREYEGLWLDSDLNKYDIPILYHL